MDYCFHPEASSELESAIAYYDGQQPGLGREFWDEVARAISLIRKFPESSPLISPRSRRRRTRRFPYGLVYQVHNERITILAIMHLRRKPNYWMGREDGD
jgi:plasmid stabilization system protein ParE